MRDTLLPQTRQITRAVPHGLLTTAHHQMHGIAKLLFQQGKTLLQMCQPSRPREGPQTLLAVLQAALTIPHQAFPGLEQTLPPLLPLLPRPLKTTGGRTQAQAALATLEPVFLPLQPSLACALQRQGELVQALPVFAPQGPEQLGRVGRGSRTNVGRHVGQGHVHFMADTGQHRDL